jgi:hypothetical protein
MKMLYFFFPVFLFCIIITGCSASTGSRYEKIEKTEKIKEIPPKKNESPEPVIDITPYRETFDIETLAEDPVETEELDLFFTYDIDTSAADESREIVSETDGYRVQIIATDNLEEANQIRSEIYFKTNQKSVYITFDPPFYKVKAGDFTQISEARDFNFKLSQMGYKETRVVSEKVNVFK